MEDHNQAPSFVRDNSRSRIDSDVQITNTDPSIQHAPQDHAYPDKNLEMDRKIYVPTRNTTRKIIGTSQ